MFEKLEFQIKLMMGQYIALYFLGLPRNGFFQNSVQMSQEISAIYPIKHGRAFNFVDQVLKHPEFLGQAKLYILEKPQAEIYQNCSFYLATATLTENIAKAMYGGKILPGETWITSQCHFIIDREALWHDFERNYQNWLKDYEAGREL